MAQPPALDDDLPPTATNVADSGDKSQATLDDLVAKATAKYATKDYSSAAEYYSRATELQAELNGEMSTKNADLLYLYGRCLYHLAVQNSDVLGTTLVGEEKAKQAHHTQELKALSDNDSRENTGASKASAKPLENAATKKHDHTSVAEEASASMVQRATEMAQQSDAESHPFFSITGDENWDDSEDELAGDGQDAEDQGDEGAEDDFSNAFEVLDIGRVLIEKRLKELNEMKEQQELNGKATDLGNTILEIKRLRERLADTRDLQAEISLEAERFEDATVDLQVALDIKKELVEFGSSIIAEAHYKLSLALEFSSITPALDENGQPQPGTIGKVDEKIRADAARHMEQAIQSCRQRIQTEELLFSNSGNEDMTQETLSIDSRKPIKITRQAIEDVKEMVLDMEQRLKELKQAPVSVKQTAAASEMNELGGLLSTLAESTPEDQRIKLQEAVGKANDLSGLVKRRKNPQSEKRKANDDPDGAAFSEKRARG